jgi:hypothetical protein
VRHFGQEFVGPLFETWRIRLRQMKPMFKYFCFPSRQELLRYALVGRVGAAANLTAAYAHPHLPLLASLLFEDCSHRVSDSTPVGGLG